MSAGPQSAREWAEKAAEAQAAGDLAAAIAALEAAIALDPVRAVWHHRLGELRDRRREWTEAEEAFRAAAELQPERAVRQLRLGRTREKRWDLRGAERAYATAVAMAPERTQWAARLDRVRQARARFHPFTGAVIAHRGRSGGRAENAVTSLDHLPPWAAGVEVDVRLSRDRVPVLMHDQRVDRTTTGVGAVAELSYADLTRLRMPDGAPVAALAAYLDACAGRGFAWILLDVKSPDRVTLDAVAAVVRASPVADSCVLMVRDGASLALARRTGRHLRRGCFGTTLDNVDDRIGAARDHGAELLLVAFGGTRYLAHREAVARAQAAGIGAGASTINSRRALEAARVDGCDVLLTDLADQLECFAGIATDQVAESTAERRSR